MVRAMTASSSLRSGRNCALEVEIGNFVSHEIFNISACSRQIIPDAAILQMKMSR